MNHLRLMLLGALLIAMAAASAAHAQGAPLMTLDATLGKGVGRSDGEYLDNRVGLTADVMLGLRVRSMTGGALVAGVSGSVQGAGGSDDICVPAPDGCVPSFPQFDTVGALVGWQDRNARVRATAGAAYVQADWRDWSVAWQGRIDLALPMASHFAGVASLRATIVPNYPRGDAFQLFAAGVGLRVF